MANPSLRNLVEIPLDKISENAQFFSFHHLSDEKEHIAIGLGPKTDTPLVRIHSECLTGDVFRSLKCDCGYQLDESIKRIQKEGGYLLYLRQEGRGIGLYNKLDAYALQAEGKDTFEANEELGFAKDLRNYKVAAEMLKVLQATKIRILTNNPDKVEQLKENQIEILEVLSTAVHANVHNQKYLVTKEKHAKHNMCWNKKN